MATPMKTMLKAIFLISITITILALSSVSATSYDSADKVISQDYSLIGSVPSKRVSRFLAHRGSLRPADHCHKDYEVCSIEYGVNSTCCGNKCFDLTTDKHNCGACHNKCKFTNTCCNAKCVDLSYDKRHCGSCNNKCLEGQYCIYGMCDYA